MLANFEVRQYRIAYVWKRISNIVAISLSWLLRKTRLCFLIHLLHSPLALSTYPGLSWYEATQGFTPTPFTHDLQDGLTLTWVKLEFVSSFAKPSTMPSPSFLFACNCDCLVEAWHRCLSKQIYLGCLRFAVTLEIIVQIDLGSELTWKFDCSFHYIALADNKIKLMPEPSDLSDARSEQLAYKEARLLTNPKNSALKGQVSFEVHKSVLIEPSPFF